MSRYMKYSIVQHKIIFLFPPLKISTMEAKWFVKITLLVRRVLCNINFFKNVVVLSIFYCLKLLEKNEEIISKILQKMLSNNFT